MPEWSPHSTTKALVKQEAGYSAHSMRATFITTSLENGAKFENVQDADGHANPSTTRLFNRTKRPVV